MRYQVQSGPLSGLEVGGSIRHVGDRASSQVPSIEIDGYTVGNLRASYPINDDLNVGLNVINVTDELYVESAGIGMGLLSGANTFGSHRTFRLALRGRF